MSSNKSVLMAFRCEPMIRQAIEAIARRDGVSMSRAICSAVTAETQRRELLGQKHGGVRNEN